MTRRIFSVRLNLDEMAADLDGCLDDADRLAWFDGFRLGCRGIDCPVSWDGHRRVGHFAGMKAHTEAVEYQAKQVQKSRLGVEARWGRDARGNARGNASGMPEALPAAMPDACPDVYLSNIEHRTSNIEQPVAVAKPAAAAPPDSNPRPSEDLFADAPPIASRPMPRRALNLADLRALFPALLVFDADREAAAQSILLYSGEMWRAALTELAPAAERRPRGKNRVMFAEVQAWLRRVELAVEDYERAGMDAPPGTPTQAVLNGRGPAELSA